jgi:CubicO group peptidase (beta-lactamase class C family)
MTSWLANALDYIPRWIDFQRELLEQPGVSVAIMSGQDMVLEHASGTADLSNGAALTPRHRMRVASHSKTFTAAGIMMLHEAGKIRVDDPAGKFVAGLHADVANVTVQQLLSHSAGITRDGPDAGQFHDRKAYLSREEMLADLAKPQPLPPATTFKYSNHGLALAGMIIEAVTGDNYSTWARNQIIAAAGLRETEPEYDAARVQPFARGHTMKHPFGRRMVIPGDSPGRAISSAGGYVSTSADLARFYAQLAPSAKHSFLSPQSRREMTRRHWRDAHSVIERYYGLGTISGPPGAWEWVGHSGSWQGYISRTATLPGQGLTICVLTNAVDGAAQGWLDGIVHILKTLKAGGAARPEVADWTGRFWTLWGALDFIPAGDRVLIASPALAFPFTDATEIEAKGPDSGIVAKAQAFGDLAEPVRRTRDADGKVRAIWLGGKELKPTSDFAAEFLAKYGRPQS